MESLFYPFWALLLTHILLSFYSSMVGNIYVLRKYVFRMFCEISLVIISLTILIIHKNPIWIINIVIWFVNFMFSFNMFRIYKNEGVNFKTIFYNNRFNLENIYIEETLSLINCIESKAGQFLSELQEVEDKAKLENNTEVISRVQETRDCFNKVTKSIIDDLKDAILDLDNSDKDIKNKE